MSARVRSVDWLRNAFATSFRRCHADSSPSITSSTSGSEVSARHSASKERVTASGCVGSGLSQFGVRVRSDESVRPREGEAGGVVEWYLCHVCGGGAGQEDLHQGSLSTDLPRTKACTG
jgi:hypothetical protein